MVEISRKDESNFEWDRLVEVMAGFFALDDRSLKNHSRRWRIETENFQISDDQNLRCEHFLR